MHTIRKLFRDARGVGAIEYAMIASLVSIAAITGYANLGSKVQLSFTGVNDILKRHL